MKLSTISIKNYRSLHNPDTINLNELSVILGENNAGKSNLLNSIKLVLTNGNITPFDFFNTSEAVIFEFSLSELNSEEKGIFADYLVDDKLTLKISFNLTDEECEKAVEIKSKVPKEEFLRAVIEERSDRTLATQVKNDSRLNEYIIDPTKFLKADAVEVVKKYIRNNPQIESEEKYIIFNEAKKLYSFIPRFLFIPAVKEVDKELSGGKDSLFSEILGSIFEILCSDDDCKPELKKDREKRDSIKKLCEQINNQFNNPQNRLGFIKKLEEDISKSLSEHICKTGVHLDFSTPSFQEILSLPHISLDDGTQTDVNKKGQGLQRSLLLTLLRIFIDYRRENNSGKQFFVGIEEPEIYLHPHSQRKMFDILSELSKTNQVFITTHSAVLINKMSNPENIIKLNKTGKETTSKQIKKEWLNDDDLFKIKQNLTVGNSEMFFSKKSVFVEGDTEKFALPLFARELGLDFDEKGISIVSTGGGDNFEPFLKLAIKDGFDIPYILICDEDKIDKMIVLLDKYKVLKKETFKDISQQDKIKELKKYDCYIFETDFETTIVKNVKEDIILECLKELEGKSITKEKIEEFTKTTEQKKNDIKNSFGSYIKRKLGIQQEYPHIEKSYKELIEQIYKEALEKKDIKIDKPYFEKQLVAFMRNQNKPRLGNKLGEKIKAENIPTIIKEIITALKS